MTSLWHHTVCHITYSVCGVCMMFNLNSLCSLTCIHYYVISVGMNREDSSHVLLHSTRTMHVLPGNESRDLKGSQLPTCIVLLGQAKSIHSLSSPPACYSGKFHFSLLYHVALHVCQLYTAWWRLLLALNVSSANKTVVPWSVILLDPSQNSLTTAEEELDERLREALEMEDQDLMVDLRELNKGHSDMFAVFWEKMNVYLNESSAVHERRHGEVTYMAKAVSVRDLIQEVAKMCPGEPVPSEQWVRLQFCPRNPRAKTASQYRSQFKVKWWYKNVSSDITMLMPIIVLHCFGTWESLPSLFRI